MASKKPTMAQAYKAAAKPKDKGIIGEGKDVLGAMGNQVKQDAQFVGALGKGAVKGAKAVAKGAEKVAGKVANITVGDVASAPKDVLKNIGKGAAKVGSLMYPEGNPMLRIPPNPKYQPKKVPAPKPAPKKDKSGGTLMDSYKAAGAALSSKIGTKSPSAGTRSKTAVDRNYANYARDRKALGLPVPPQKPAPKKSMPKVKKK